MKRYKNIAGKYIRNRVYVHKQYVDEVYPGLVLRAAKRVIGEFKYNCVMFDLKSLVVRFDSASDFDTAREPHVGEYVSVPFGGGAVTRGYSNAIWHHKWLWVKDDYQGFDVERSKHWSEFWKEMIPEVAKSTDRSFNAQLRKYGLEKLSCLK